MTGANISNATNGALGIMQFDITFVVYGCYVFIGASGLLVGTLAANALQLNASSATACENILAGAVMNPAGPGRWRLIFAIVCCAAHRRCHRRRRLHRPPS